MMEPKLEDVAKVAGVSKTTVSRVINKRGYLSQATIDKVNAAIETLNYHPNAMARQLFKSKTNLIGLLLPSVANPFFGELANDLERLLYQHGYRVLVGNSMNDPEKERAYLNELLSKQVDGLIVGTHNQNIQEYHRTNLPIVAIDRYINADIPVVASDNYAGGELATTYLLDHGAQHIIHINGPRSLATPAQRRRDAYEDTLRKRGMTPTTYEVDFNISEENKKALFRSIFTNHPEVDAIFAANDTDAALILQLAGEFGRQVPNDLLLVGYDGSQLVRELRPDLTTIVQPIAAMAEQAVTVLNQRINETETAKEYILPVTLYKGTTA